MKRFICCTVHLRLFLGVFFFFFFFFFLFFFLISYLPLVDNHLYCGCVVCGLF
jgi:hypothetical protein